METFFRQYFWAVHLVFLALAAFFGARTVNAYFAGKLAPLPNVGDQAPAPAAALMPSEKPQLSMEAIAKATGLKVPEPEPSPEEAAASAPVLANFDDQVAVKSSLRAKLVGTMVANRPEWSMANVEDGATRSVGVYMLGDVIQGASVTAISRFRMEVNNNGRKEFIDQEGGDPSGAPPPIAVSTAPARDTSAANIKAVGEGTYEITREELNKQVSDLNNIATQARVVPAFKDGVSQGFKLFSIRPDSLYSKIGIKNGDIVKKINGFEINSPDRALEVYTKLKDANRIEVELDREGANKKMTYDVK